MSNDHQGYSIEQELDNIIELCGKKKKAKKAGYLKLWDSTAEVTPEKLKEIPGEKELSILLLWGDFYYRWRVSKKYKGVDFYVIARRLDDNKDPIAENELANVWWSTQL